ncbi:MAG: hypothetical protein RLZZ326_2809 [Planctomycetota bacterium]|jgi:hypothetical protein
MDLLLERYRLLTDEWDRIRAAGLIQTSPSGYRRATVKASRLRAILRELRSIEKRRA